MSRVEDPRVDDVKQGDEKDISSSQWTEEDEALFQIVLQAGANPGEGGTK